MARGGERGLLAVGRGPAERRGRAARPIGPADVNSSVAAAFFSVLRAVRHARAHDAPQRPRFRLGRGHLSGPVDRRPGDAPRGAEPSPGYRLTRAGWNLDQVG